MAVNPFQPLFSDHFENLIRTVLSKLPPEKKSKLRAIYFREKKKLVQRFLSYDPGEMKVCLRSLGVLEGDSILLHSSFGPLNGFQGSPEDFIDSLIEAVGANGNLLMVSMPYLTSTYKYLQTLRCFDVRKTASRMGLISEAFRRRKNVLRSLHPTHPVLAYGPKADWIVAEHEKSLYPCGLGSPFEKLALMNGKVVFYDVPFYTFTFFHYLEDLIRDTLPFPLYFSEPFEIPVLDHDGSNRIIRTMVFSSEANERRRPKILVDELNKRHFIKKAKVGNSRLLLVETRQAIQCAKEMACRGDFFYDLS